jgi:hypothetical protein
MSDIFSYNSMFYGDTDFTCYYPKLISEVYLRPKFKIPKGDLSNITIQPTIEILGTTKDSSNHEIILQNNIINKKNQSHSYINRQKNKHYGNTKKENRKQLHHDQKIAKQKLHIQKRKIYTNNIRKY